MMSGKEEKRWGLKKVGKIVEGSVVLDMDGILDLLRFLDVTTHRYKRSGPSVLRSVCPVLFSNDEFGHF